MTVESVGHCISKENFVAGIHGLLNLAEKSGDEEWKHCRLIKSGDDVGLRLQLTAKPKTITLTTDSGVDDNDDDHDTEALSRDDVEQEMYLTFDIIHSPIYQVPVLYTYSTAGLKAVSELFDVDCGHPPGVISLTVMTLFPIDPKLINTFLMIEQDHPWLGVPVHFVHPCRTAEAMQVIAKTNDPTRYLCIWIGIAGLPLRLAIPRSMATFMLESDLIRR